MKVQNLYSNIPAQLPDEVFDTLLQGRAVRVERIVSRGQASPPDFWYDQPDHEWVVLLAGNAGLRFAGESDTVVLRPGDYLNIPAGTRHRVEWTSTQQPTVWLALHYQD
ncbi:MAG: cupin domain-containing protein [Pseudomonadota bacterium]